MQRQRLTILGSTGSIGTSTLDIVRQFPERFHVTALSCRNRVRELAEQIQEFRPQMVCVGTAEQAQWLVDHIVQEDLQVVYGEDGLVHVAAEAESDLVVAGIVGAAGLRSTYAAVEAGRNIALANKETMVLAGELILSKAASTGSIILPVDSEHNAIFQSLVGHRSEDIEKIILTASGGPFRDTPFSEFSKITLQDALRHPNWEMGNKITIDSATMMNKGLEVIEARWLFDLPVKQIEVVIHRESIVHSLVAYSDGSFIAQLGLPDMRTPIAYCLAYPERVPLRVPKLNLAEIGKLHFEPVVPEKYPCLELAMQAAHCGGAAPAVLNGANEAVVEAYLQGQIHFLDISRILKAVMKHYVNQSDSLKILSFSDAVREDVPNAIRSIDDALLADQWGRQQAAGLLQ